MTHNVDPSEIAKFEALASRWWDPDSEFKPLHAMNPVRAGYIDEHLNIAGKAALDIGCGGGILTEALAHRGARVTGIDMTDAPLKVARLHALDSGLEGIDYRQMTAEALAEEAPGQFDVITCMEMLEHVPDPTSVIAAIERLLKPGGYAFFSTINRNPKAWVMAIVGAEYVLRLLPKGTHEYKKLIRPSELKRWAEQRNLKTLDLRGIHYNPFSNRFSLNTDVSVNYLMACRKTDAS
ncbi:MAG TPA: bifunctional 2-polyprenyl-6-hydroxyphenol methylase/3-demethylubiquinol 3-O-methyltransferase UbiG [Saccharospirillum sp.]|nr:bifunctional 2-polyprenyl-6-hydroxyphenol methylase/3-demethylubiquinol 3-O-methyltransferase UbiG [Saccharospirillum sp.]